MSKLISEFKRIHEGWELSREAQSKIDAAKTRIEEMMGKPKFREFIIKKIVDNYTPEQIEMLEKRRENLKNLTNGDTIYCLDTFDNIFDPEIDKFEINDIRVSKETRQITIYVENLTERGYLGVTGMWVPKIYSTNWINIDELERAEDN